jgi:hypothetical protein
MTILQIAHGVRDYEGLETGLQQRSRRREGVGVRRYSIMSKEY